MSVRDWTIEELNRVWPLPENWEWMMVPIEDRSPFARGYAYRGFGLWEDVFVDQAGRLSIDSRTPVAVVAAVLGAHSGRDAIHRLANRLDEMADEASCTTAFSAFMSAACLVRCGRIK